jgi:hypothetical protein
MCASLSDAYRKPITLTVTHQLLNPTITQTLSPKPKHNQVDWPAQNPIRMTRSREMKLELNLHLFGCVVSTTHTFRCEHCGSWLVS